MPRCLRWDGNGDAVILTYDDMEDAWLGFEVLETGVVSDGAECLDEGGFGDEETSYLPIRLEVTTDGEDCVFQVQRLVPYCLCGPMFTSYPC